MATTLATLLPDILGRIEEENPPVFWNETYEVLPALVDAMFDAALITGTVQAVNVPITLAATTTYFSLQNNTDIGIPAGVIAALRLKAPYPIRKTTLKGMDDTFPNWENAAPGSQLVAWGPLGVSSFFVYPQLASPVTVMMDFLVSPVNVPRPYTTAIQVPFLTEFTDLLPMGAAVMLRAKELGAEVEEAAQVLNDYMGQLRNLSLYQSRLDALVLTSSYGAKAGVQTQKREVV
jgi:hypothetical protein